MTEYYYSKNPQVRHHLRRLSFSALGLRLQFITDNGVFSKSAVDHGSQVIINYAPVGEMPDGMILDLGCGYGPIGITLAKYYPQRRFLLTDVNNLALKLAKKNAHINRVTNVRIFSSDVYSKINQHLAGIITNPPIRAGKKVVMTILKKADHYLLPNGILTAVVRRKQGEPSAKRAMKNTFGNCQIIKRDKGYYVLKSVKKEV